MLQNLKKYSAPPSKKELKDFLEVQELVRATYKNYHRRCSLEGAFVPGVKLWLDLTAVERLAHDYVMMTRNASLHDISDGLDANKKISFISCLVAQEKPISVLKNLPAVSLHSMLSEPNAKLAVELFISGLDAVSTTVFNADNELHSKLCRLFATSSMDIESMEIIAYLVRR